MHQLGHVTEPAPVSRRDALRRLGILLAGFSAGCTPLRIVFHAYPHDFDEQPDMIDGILRAFVTTVIPGASADEPNLVRVFHDEFYQFAPYCSYFAADLCSRSRRLFGASRFDELSSHRRKRVIQDGLAADATTHRLYSGAVLLAQLSYYAGVYEPDRGCPLIGFEGRYRVRSKAERTYANPNTYLAAAISADGNPA